MEEHWNFHNFIAVPLETYSRMYLGASRVTADDIDLGAFVDTMLKVLMRVYGDMDELKDFSDSCRKYTGLSYHEIPDEISKSLFEQFNNLLYNKRMENVQMEDYKGKLYSNSSKKLKVISEVLFVIGCLISFIVGILIWDDYRLRWLYALIIMIVGPLLSYIQTLLLYTFAQMADDIANARKSVEE